MSKRLKKASPTGSTSTKKSESDSDTELTGVHESVTWLKKIFEVLTNISNTQDQILNEMKKSCCHNSISQPISSNAVKEQKDESWDVLLNRRKHAFYHKMRSSDIKNIYSEFLSKEPPFIPPKFREAMYPGITDKQKENKTKLEKMKLEIEIDNLNEQEEKNMRIIDEIDTSVKSKIAGYTDISKSQREKEKWIESVSREEKKSLEIWEKKKQFLINLESRIENNNQMLPIQRNFKSRRTVPRNTPLNSAALPNRNRLGNDFNRGYPTFIAESEGPYTRRNFRRRGRGRGWRRRNFPG